MCEYLFLFVFCQNVMYYCKALNVVIDWISALHVFSIIIKMLTKEHVVGISAISVAVFFFFSTPFSSSRVVQPYYWSSSTMSPSACVSQDIATSGMWAPPGKIIAVQRKLVTDRRLRLAGTERSACQLWQLGRLNQTVRDVLGMDARFRRKCGLVNAAKENV